MTWDLAASGVLRAVRVSAGSTTVAGLHLTARFWALVLVLVLVVAAVYLASCVPWPYGPCLACRARKGRNPGSTSRRHGRCLVCKGTGERLRVGTRLLLAWTNGRVPKGVVRR
jgi:hypothetical protein